MYSRTLSVTPYLSLIGLIGALLLKHAMFIKAQSEFRSELTR